MNSSRKYISDTDGLRNWKIQDHVYFNHETAEDIAEVVSITPIRPLPVISDFVTGKMRINSFDDPVNEVLIAQMDNELTEMKAMLDDGGDAYLAGFTHSLDMVLLDLVFLKTYYHIQAKKSNPDLNALVDAIAKKAGRTTPLITYEDLIFINPLEKDPRVFFNGRDGRSELDFYRGHNIIEQKFEEAIGYLREILDMCDSEHIDEAFLYTKAGAFAKCRGGIMRDIGIFHSLHKENFKRFRAFFNSIEEGYRGASGAFSAGVPIIDILIGLNALDKANGGYLDDNLMFYPRDGQKHIIEARQRLVEGKSLLDYAKKHDSEALMKTYDSIREHILQFRKGHLNLIKDRAIEIYEGTIPGTGNTGKKEEMSVKSFLKANIEETKNGGCPYPHGNTNTNDEKIDA